MSNRIPSYSLFGQNAGLVKPRFCHVERVTDRWKLHGGAVEGHHHPYLHQLTFWIVGTGSYIVDDLDYAIEPATLCWVPSGTVHGFNVQDGSDAIVLSLSDDFAKEYLLDLATESPFMPLHDNSVCTVTGNDATWIGSLFERMENEYAASSDRLSQSVGALVQLVIIHIARRHGMGDGAISKAMKSEPSMLVQFLSKVTARLGERPRIAALASELGTTPYLLNRACREAFGMRASEVVRQRHLLEAKRLLMFTSLEISSVGKMVGYDDPAHFARTFRAHEGISPSDWRNSAR